MTYVKQHLRTSRKGRTSEVRAHNRTVSAIGTKLKSGRGESLKKAGLFEYAFDREWSFARKSKRMFLEPRARLTRNLLKKGIIYKIKHR